MTLRPGNLLQHFSPLDDTVLSSLFLLLCTVDMENCLFPSFLSQTPIHLTTAFWGKPGSFTIPHRLLMILDILLCTLSIWATTFSAMPKPNIKHQLRPYQCHLEQIISADLQAMLLFAHPTVMFSNAMILLTHSLLMSHCSLMILLISPYDS